MFNVGDVVMKVVGRESGRCAVVVEKVNDSFVVIDGDVKRRKCNVKHLEPVNKRVKLEKNAKKEDIIKELIAIKINIRKAKEVKRTEKKEEKKEEDGKKGRRKKV